MSASKSDDRRRVLVPHALGANEFLRATWHRRKGVVVLSHWDGAACVAAFPVRVNDLDELTQLVNDATNSATNSDTAKPAWPPPQAGNLVVPAHGLTVTRSARSARSA